MLRRWNRLCEKEKLKGIVPYVLRHSSIVRGLRAGLPIRLVAALHDTSVAMIEWHYARWITDGLEDLALKAIVPLIHTIIGAGDGSGGLNPKDLRGQRNCLQYTYDNIHWKYQSQ